MNQKKLTEKQRTDLEIILSDLGYIYADTRNQKIKELYNHLDKTLDEIAILK